MFTAGNILWVKNIKRDIGRGWAYMDPQHETEFQLGFSRFQKPGALIIQPGDIILLFQRVDKVAGVKAHTYLTHLVTPLDDLVTESNEVPSYPFQRRVSVVAKTTIDTAIFTTADILNFHKPNRGKICEIALLSDKYTTREIQQIVWDAFQGYISKEVPYLQILLNSTLSPEENNFSALEGTEKKEFRRHLIRERNKTIIDLAKQRALESGGGKIVCECCGFNFANYYGIHGEGFIECHHKQPIHLGGVRVTTLDDLAMVCANCHRMLHRRNCIGEYHSIDSLKQLINA